MVFLDSVEQKYVEELGGMNLYFVHADGRIVTPATGTILEGITRASIIELAGKLGHQVEERRFSVDEWRDGVASGEITEIFACGTAAVVTPVGTLKWDGGEVGDARRPGPGRAGDPEGARRHPVRPRRRHVRLDAPDLLTAPRLGYRRRYVHDTGVLQVAENTAARDGLVGNRWVLIGGVVYLLEWVAIIWTGALGVGETVTRGTALDDLVDSYTGHVDAVATMAGWFSVVLLGRILVFIGLRHALAESGYRHPLLDLAVAAAAVSVALEVASYGVGAASAERVEAGEPAQALLLDQAGTGLNLMILGGLGVAVAATSWCMWRSGLFSVVLNILGFVAGTIILGAQLTVAPARSRSTTCCTRPSCCSGSGCSGRGSCAGGARRAAGQHT